MLRNWTYGFGLGICNSLPTPVFRSSTVILLVTCSA